MMRLIIGSSLHFRYLVLALGVVLTWFGLARLRDVPVDVFPEFAPPRVEIQTICLGLSSAEVEQLVEPGLGDELQPLGLGHATELTANQADLVIR